MKSVELSSRMGRSSEEETNLSASKLDDYVYKVYKQLKNGGNNVKVSANRFRCPYCVMKQKQEYLYQDLLEHAKRIGDRSRGEGLKQKGKHLALYEYLKEYHRSRVSPGPSEMSNLQERHDQNEKYVWPWKGIIANIPVEKKDGRYVGESGSNLRDELARKGFNPLKVIPLWNRGGHSGYAVVNFNKDLVGFGNAVNFEKAFASDFHGKLEWYRGLSHGDKLFGWVARENDYNSRGVIGEHLRKNGDFKSIADIVFEEDRKQKSLESNLRKTNEAKAIQCEEMKTKVQQVSASVSKIQQETDEMTQHFNEEMRRMQHQTCQHSEKIYADHEKFKQDPLYQKEELEQRERELEKRETDDVNERTKLRCLKKKNESASLEQLKVDQKVLALAETHKREKEALHKKMIDLQEQIDQRQALELQIEKLKGDVHVMGHMGGDMEMRRRLDAVKEELKDKREELEYEEALTQTLIVKERNSNNELQEARKALINMRSFLWPKHFQCSGRHKAFSAHIGVKIMGVLDEKVFRAAAKAKYSTKEAPTKAKELITLWKTHIADPHWHPFKVIRENGADKEIVNEEDERLKSLRSELGDEACQAVMTAISELNEYNGTGRYPVAELWSRKEGRKATLKEGAEFIVKRWSSRKRKR